MPRLPMTWVAGVLASLGGPDGDARWWYSCPLWPDLPWWATPWGAAALWVSLHSADYLLTIAAARLRAHPSVAERVTVPGSMELNPLFQRAVDGGQYLSPRFLLTLALGALLFPGAAWLLESPLCFFPGGLSGYLVEFLTGALVLTRGALIAVHLQNLSLFRRLVRVPEAAEVRVHYDRGTVLMATRARKLEWAGFAAVALVVTGRLFFLGGLLALLALAALLTWWGRRPHRAAPPPPGATAPSP